jgi:ribokinase
MKSKILVIGSSNTDMVVKTTRIPAPGETVLGGHFFMNGGGKGANQAVASARLGGDVSFVCKTGNDIFGREAIASLEKDNIDTGFIFTDANEPSGIALITVDEHGENCIVVAPGANSSLRIGDMEQIEDLIVRAGIILLQLEIPLETVSHIAAVAAGRGIPVILNPAPAQQLPDELLRNVSIITPNENEAEKLTGIPVTDIRTAIEAAQSLFARGVETIIVTLGADGALLVNGNGAAHIPGYRVEAIDTTAAGDVFNGALVVGLSEKKSIEDSIAFACKAAAISVTRLGAQTSAPKRKEVNAFTFAPNLRE